MQTWRRKVKVNVQKIGLKDVANQTRWREKVRAIAKEMRCIRPHLISGKNDIKIR